MRSLNRVTLLGNVGNDPEIKHFEKTSKATFSLATSKQWKDKSGEKKEATEWHNLEVWGPLAKAIEQYVKRGTRLYVEGELRTDSWEANDGQKRYRTIINVRDFSMMSPPQKQEPSSQPVNAEPIPGSYEQEDDDLPF